MMNSGGCRSWTIRKYGRRTEKGWLTIDDASGVINLVLQDSYFLVLQNASVLESVELTQYTGRIQGVIKGNLLMIVIQQGQETPSRKFRVLFVRDDQSGDVNQPMMECIKVLRTFFPVRDVVVSDSVAFEMTTLQQTLQEIITSSANISNERFSDSVPIGGALMPTSALEEEIRLYLLDPTFPELVNSVAKCLESILNEDKTS